MSTQIQIQIKNLKLCSLVLTTSIANYENIKKCLDESGEVMIILDNNESIELHKHNVKFDDASQEIIIDARTETYWIGADKVSYYWIHKEGFSKE
ncbi:hypothetical protein [Candidatus Nitrosocosmicus sp. SS]|uniref:hypothetical protein n=1 Tax=Candidatus Nitrosocosmicus agrestis TaxID=2563600 RepID=UPI00122DD0CF|nr:hypothetical protein [Candidatus Nitrosocosmicus sp. SS]KAA2281367.1 hypothetical protein F1Z66_08255 [Candidatus Nitrosocosmicus sp. SS]KAF0867723.1 hypothetical protein E5N71_13835 [Candidatus Nitrosocosmicus sp. SS]MDR4492471.1 hypothetical protein [Candidatus Nitrosocosmicus sp.]